MQHQAYADPGEHVLRPGECYQPALGRVLYSAAWLERSDDDRLAHEVTVLARRLGVKDTPLLVARHAVLARSHEEAALLAAHELITSRSQP